MAALFLAFALAVPAAAQQDREEEWGALRERMVQEQVAARGVRDSATLAAMRGVPRHEFVPAQVRRLAYEDSPLPIGQRPDHLPTVHRGADDRAGAAGEG